MHFINHTLEWYKGEAFESLVSSVFGVLLIIVALYSWRMGTTQGAHALVIPLLLIGLLLVGFGSYGYFKNQNAIKHFEQVQPKEMASFIQSEKERVEGFQSLYTFTKYLALSLFALAMIIFFFIENKNWQAIAIAFIIIGISGLIIDYFSEERANNYYSIILEYVKQSD
ncbi:MAG: hypothetical protein OXC67_05945 [Flavobacteriaceae bacterium]|nr:hypothetical protein [Flavobacteriaceae bacterium]